jgi:hypothetical protein
LKNELEVTNAVLELAQRLNGSPLKLEKLAVAQAAEAKFLP